MSLPEERAETEIEGGTLLGSVFEAVNKVMRDVGAVAKDQRNTAQKFSFRGVDQVVNAVAPALREHGVIVAPVRSTLMVREITSGGGKRQAWVTGTVGYTVYGPEGDTMPVEVATEATDFADKATAKAMSVAYRIMLLQLLNLPTDDPDPDSEYVERGSGGHSAPAGRSAAKAAESKTVGPDQLRQQIFELCERRGISRGLLVTTWATVGDGKITDCRDAGKLRALLDLLTEIDPNQEA
ncbi:ERF family protein [Nocardia transvalensis]|uniref:ERF family protein n=1 Tax=Nocardia transvalensis TaxID=37333 RepID=UPI0018933BA8|nr:ERF family protein [Nocardia transvalensis]MBF6333423.1 ERF family protein [Nocardia transvalensis]